MTQVIAGTYEIIGKIGSGGGGDVYLAHHLRLDKKVVLKADKRKISTPPELLRVEVDVLKHLSHTYIPQVYDFFTENGTVYTAMDYIEGESFDKALKEGKTFTQAQVIRWGRQLLEALSYLHRPIHGDPPHGYTHSDIKPANLMLTPQGDIRLIDFNISLALGEETIIGRSEGYASPEHYGLDFSNDEAYSGKGSTATVRSDRNRGTSAFRRAVSTVSGRSSSGGYRGTTGSHYQLIRPDVRSDIYSTGATLYHLLSGRRPASHAKKVIPLPEKEFSPQLVHIISKAMEPNPNLRYQTADEMLEAFNRIREDDIRAVHMRIQNRIMYALLTTCCVLGAGISFLGLKRMETIESWKKLSEYSRTALQEGDSVTALKDALEALPQDSSILHPGYIAEAQKALADALGIYDLSDGYRPQGTLELPSAPFFMEISPDGRTAAFVCASDVQVYDLTSRSLLAELSAADSALAEAAYLDTDTLIYAGQQGLTRYDISEGKTIWTGQKATAIDISQDGKTVASIYKDDTQVNITDAESGKVRAVIDLQGRHPSVTANDVFANPNDNLLALNQDGTWAAVSMSDGSLEIFDLRNGDKDAVIYDSGSGYTHFEGGFYEHYFACAASNTDSSVFLVVDMNTLRQTGGFASDSRFSVRTDASGIYVQTDNLLVQIDPATGEQRPLVTTTENILAYATGGEHTLIASKDRLSFYDKNALEIDACEQTQEADFVRLSDGTAVIGSRSTPTIRLMAYENHQEAEIFSYDPSYQHSEARVSADGERIMLFSWKNFRIYDRNGNLMHEADISDADQIFDQQFRRQGEDSWLEVIYNDGRSLLYRVSDGTLEKETRSTAPDRSLYEEFTVNGLKITSPLHGAPTAYDAKTGKLVGVLSEEDYLTYVTPVGENFVAQFTTADGYFYGQLLNGDCEVLAEFPYLCDVINNVLIFDYPTGNLRQSRIYDTEQLISAAHTVLGKEQ
ncbi:protein kinase [Oscillospiraceae bacterium Marseille-Q3528]|nr:protein kinase [Oscillospiraceae bacterium Marseille-Q3528]